MRGLSLDLNSINAVGVEPSPTPDPTLAALTRKAENLAEEGKAQFKGLDLPGKQKLVDHMNTVVLEGRDYAVDCGTKAAAQRLRLRYYRARRILQDRGIESLNTVKFALAGPKQSVLILSWEPDPTPQPLEDVAKALGLSVEDLTSQAENDD